MSKTPVTIDSLLTRIKREVQQREKQSAAKKLEARHERLRRAEPTSIFQREELWHPVAVHRQYEVQHCDSCKQEQTCFSHDKIELRHKLQPSARRWRYDRGEGVGNLPVKVHIVEHTIPECFACASVGKVFNTLFNSKEAA